MRRRILAAMLLVTALTIVLFGVPLGLLIERFVDQAATLRLEREAILAARDVPFDFATSTDPVELPAPESDTQLALFDLTGRRIAGHGPSQADPSVLAALRNDIHDSEVDGNRIIAVPVTANEHVIGVIRAEQSTGASDARILALIGGLLGLAGLVFAAGALGAAVLARRLAQPVKALSTATVELGCGDFAPHLPVSGIEEIDDAAAALKRTGLALQTLMDRERAFSADASHQLRTPLAGMKAAIETELAFPRDRPERVLAELLEDVERLEKTIAALLQAARDHNTYEATVDPSHALEIAMRAWHGRLAREGRPLRLAGDTSPPRVRGTETLLTTALDVLLDNAMVHGRGVVGIEVTLSASAVTLSVTDEGPGLTQRAASESDRLHGHGLELAQRLVTSIGGRLTIALAGPSPHVDLVLPRAESERPDGSGNGRDGSGREDHGEN